MTNLEILKRSIELYGYARVNRCRYEFGPNFDPAFNALRVAARALPRDRYDNDAGRHRLLGRYIHVPDLECEDKLIAVQPKHYAFCDRFGIEFTQPANINSDAGGVRRVLEPFTQKLYQNIALKTLVRYFLAAVPFDEDVRKEPIQIGLHLVRLDAGRNKPAVASPPVVHRDGEPFTCAVLLDRENAEGGLNAITTTKWHDHRFEDVPIEDVITSFTLERPGDGYVVADDRVAHYVGPVNRVDQDRPGYRTILLIDFVPLRPALVLDGIAAE